MSKEAPSLKEVMAGLGWDARATDVTEFDLHASAKANSKVRTDADFIFYDNKAAVDRSVTHMGDNRTGAGDGDEEQVNVNPATVPAEPALVGKVAVAGTTHHDETRRQWFRQVSNAFIRMVNFGDNNELACYNLTEDGSSERPMILGDLYRAGAE